MTAILSVLTFKVTVNIHIPRACFQKLASVHRGHLALSSYSVIFCVHQRACCSRRLSHSLYRELCVHQHGPQWTGACGESPEW